MALTMHPTGLGSGIDKDRQDYTIYTGGWDIGRIYERKGFPDHLRFLWSLHGVVLTRPPDIRTDGHTPSLEAAKAEFRGVGCAGLSGRNWGRRAKFLHNAVAQSLRIALTSFRKINDLACERFIGKIAAISKSKRYPRHFVCKAHDPDRLGVELLAIEVGADRHVHLPACRRQCYRTLSHRRLGKCRCR